MRVILREKENIKRLFSYPLGTIAPRSPLSVLSYMLLDAEEKFEVTATDLEVETSIRLGAEIEEGRRICVKADRLKMIIEKAEYEELVLSLYDSMLKIETERGEFHLKTVSAEEFPERFKIKKEVWCVVDTREIADAIAKTEFSVSTERTRYTLNGVFMKLKKNILEIVSTDGRRLSLVRKNVLESKGETDGIIVSVKALKILRQICSKEDDDSIKLFFSDSYFGVETEFLRVIARNVEGQFPDYESVIPTDCSNHLTVDRVNMHQAVVEGSLAGEKDAEAVTLDIEKDRVTISSHSIEGEEAFRRIDCSFEGEETRISFNPQYLLQPLSVMKAESVTLSFKEKDAAALLFSPEEKDYKCVIMPLSID